MDVQIMSSFKRQLEMLPIIERNDEFNEIYSKVCGYLLVNCTHHIPEDTGFIRNFFYESTYGKKRNTFHCLICKEPFKKPY